MEYGVRAALRSVTRLTGGDFDSPGARALLASVEAHAIGAGRSPSAVFVGLALAAHAHSATGWPIPVGGSQAITDALVAELVSLGATIETGRWVRHVSELDDSAALLLDATPAGFLELTAGHPRAESFRSRVRHFRYGPGIAKLDITLDGPIPWTSQRLSEVGTVHLGGDQRAIIAGERAISRGRLARTPFILVSQPSVFDATRAPEGKHVVWAYAHVPPGSPVTMSRPIIAAIEKQAPGFRDLIRNASQSTAWQLPAENPNYVGGDISAGATSLRQILGRPYLSASPWRSPVPGVYLCSASTAPGPGVHGMSGWYAAREALRHEFGIRLPSL